jgi:hypothetical protein
MDPRIAAASARIQGWKESPARFVAECFGVEPDAWQVDVLNAAAGMGVKRICMKACAGPGKTAVLAWLAWWHESTQAEPGMHPKGIAVAVSEDNLKTNLWPELAKWQQRSPLLMQLFTWQSERIFLKEHPQTWFLAARSFPKSANTDEQGRVLSGLHSEYPLVLIDESGDIAPSVGRAAEQAMGGARSGLIVQAGNPTSQKGLLYESAVKRRDRWRVITITADPEDPKRTPRVSKEWAQEQIDTHGRDNPWLQAYVLGIFPTTALNALLSAAEVEAAIGRHYREDQYIHQAKVLGVDCARFGDDRTVLFRRQGLASFPPQILRGARSEQIAGCIATIVRDWQPDAIFIDGSGGYGAGTVDALRLAHITAQEVHGSGQPIDQRNYNKRAECWWGMAEWVKAGGALPPDTPEIVAELTEPTYWLHKGRLQIEEKDQIKKRLHRSPDLADALALTFTQPVMPARRPDHRGLWYQPPKQSSDFDPFRPEA